MQAKPFQTSKSSVIPWQHIFDLEKRDQNTTAKDITYIINTACPTVHIYLSTSHSEHITFEMGTECAEEANSLDHRFMRPPCCKQRGVHNGLVDWTSSSNHVPGRWHHLYLTTTELNRAPSIGIWWRRHGPFCWSPLTCRMRENLYTSQW